MGVCVGGVRPPLSSKEKFTFQCECDSETKMTLMTWYQQHFLFQSLIKFNNILRFMLNVGPLVYIVKKCILPAFLLYCKFPAILLAYLSDRVCNYSFSLYCKKCIGRITEHSRKQIVAI